MRLRSRVNKIVEQGDVGRSALSDVSNKRSAPSDFDAGHTVKSNSAVVVTKKLKTALNVFVSSSNTANNENEGISTRKTLSARVMKNQRRSKSNFGDNKIKQEANSVKHEVISVKHVVEEIEDKSKAIVDAEVREISGKRSIVHGKAKKRATSTSNNRTLYRTQAQKKCLIPYECRMQRSNFNGNNHTQGIALHDMKDKDDELKVANYVTDLMQHLYGSETASAPGLYMSKQRDINEKMRAILVDWLVEVHMKFRLVTETLYLCVNIIDRYCSLVPVPRSKLQLVGVTALLIACKYEEIYPPEVRDCVYITDKAYHRQEVLDMEQDILKLLHFKFTVPTAYPFLVRFLNIVSASKLSKFAANYYMERTLQEHDLLKYRPSLVCAACVALAINNPDIARIEDEADWKHPGLPAILLEYTNFTPNEVIECAKVIAQKVGEEPVTASRRQLVAVKRKYENRRYMHVSSAVSLPTLEGICKKLKP